MKIYRENTKLPIRKLLPFFVLAILVVICSPELSAQSNARFEHIGKDDGLSHISVSSIVQDQRGFLWFGTQSGLNRYDGYEFKTFKEEPFNHNSLSHDLVQTLYMDKGHTLWVGTYNGLNKFNTLTYDVTRYLHDPEDSETLSGDVIVSIMRDSQGDLWIGTLDGLNKFNEETETFTRYKADEEDPMSLPDNTIRDLFEDKAGRLWIATYDGLAMYRPNSDDFVTYRIDPERNGGKSSDYIMDIASSGSDRLWVGTWKGGGLYRFDVESKRFTAHPVPDGRCYTLNTQSEGKLLVGTWGGGMVEVDEATGTVLDHHSRSKDEFSLSHDIVYSLFRDRSGILWVGTNGGGINKMCEPTNEFTYFTDDPDDPASLSKGKVNCVYVDSRGTLWVGVYDGGLNKYEAEKGKMVHYRADSDDPSSLSDDIVNNIFEDNDGSLWISTHDGLNRFDRKTESFEVYMEGEPPFELQDNIIYDVQEDDEGNFWIGTYSEGLTRYSLETGEVTHFSYDPDDPHSLNDDMIYDIKLDSKGILWVATNNGLNRYEEEREEFTRFTHDIDDRTSLTSSTVRDVYEDSKGRLWIGTVSGGLLRYNREEENFRYYMEEQGLPGNTIYGIVEDYRGRLWLSTNDTLVVFDPEEETFQQVDEDNGIWAESFSIGHFVDEEGRVYFGTNEGLYRIVPSDFEQNTHKPPIYLTSFRIFDEKAELDTPLTEVESIQIRHEDRYISFEFAALDYLSPEKNRYAYKLEGFDEEWIYSGNRRYVGYTNIPPGEYTFRVKASNNDNVWNEEGISVDLEVIPPLWRTWWAYTSYTLAGVLLLVAVFLFFSREQKRKYELQTQELERTRLAELEKEVNERRRAQREMVEAKEEAEKANRTKNDFIANMSHEIRTPMNAIIGYTQLIENSVKDSTILSFIRIIQRSGRQLLSLINELLDLSVVEAGKLKVHFGPVDVPTILEDISAVYTEKAREKGIELSTTIDADAPKRVILDEMRIRQVLYNLIGNALKFTERGGVSVEVSAEPAGEASGQSEGETSGQSAGEAVRYRYRIAVKDTGIGIPREEQTRIFDPFSQKDGQSERYGGTGLGLAISRRLVEAMGGYIELDSEEGEGSTFLVEFPSLLVEEKKSEEKGGESDGGTDSAEGATDRASKLTEDSSEGATASDEGVFEEEKESTGARELSEFDFSGDEENIRNALERLEGDLKRRWQANAGTIFVEEWRHFAEDLRDLGEENELPGLKDYAGRIEANVRDFHIEELKNLVSLYPDIIEEYRRQVGL